jgi:hypothetical protein
VFILLFVVNLPTNTVGAAVDEYDNDNDDDDDDDDNDDDVVIADRRNRCNDMEFVDWNAKENVVVAVFVDENVNSKSKAIRIRTFLVVVTIVNLSPFPLPRNTCNDVSYYSYKKPQSVLKKYVHNCSTAQQATYGNILLMQKVVGVSHDVIKKHLVKLKIKEGKKKKKNLVETSRCIEFELVLPLIKLPSFHPAVMLRRNETSIFSSLKTWFKKRKKQQLQPAATTIEEILSVI